MDIHTHQIPYQVFSTFGLARAGHEIAFDRINTRTSFGLLQAICVFSWKRLKLNSTPIIYTTFEPTTYWWTVLKAMGVFHVKSTPLLESWEGKPVKHGPHRSDIVRLCKIYEHGGIYLDSDIIVLRPFFPMMHHDLVIGREKQYGYCNAVLLAKPKNAYIWNWLESFPSANLDDWNGFSVKRPMEIIPVNDPTVSIQPENSFFFPSWDELELIFDRTDTAMGSSYCLHLWRAAAEREGKLKDISIKKILEGNSLFDRVARPILVDLLTAVTQWEESRIHDNS